MGSISNDSFLLISMGEQIRAHWGQKPRSIGQAHFCHTLEGQLLSPRASSGSNTPAPIREDMNTFFLHTSRVSDTA